MRHSIKISVMTLIAMFAFSTVADAQFGMLKSLGKDLGIGKKKAKISAYDENAQMPKNPMARTIFTDPNTGEKMMLDRSASCDRNAEVSWEWFQKAMLDSWKDEELSKKAAASFSEKYGNWKPYEFLGINKPKDTKMKIGYIGAAKSSWTYVRDKWGEVVGRVVDLNVVMEFSDGENVYINMQAYQPNIGGGNYDEDATEMRYWHNDKSETCVNARTVNGWEVRTDCFTSTLASK